MISFLPSLSCDPFLGHPKIIHRDIKSANILLEDDFEVQASESYIFPVSGFFHFLMHPENFFLLFVKGSVRM